MSSIVLDASALLAVLLEERGGEEVGKRGNDWLLSAVNLSEVVASGVERGLPMDSVIAALSGLTMEVIAFDAEQAYLAASLRPLTRKHGLSFGDRACLALGMKTGCPVVTADTAWERCELEVEVVRIR